MRPGWLAVAASGAGGCVVALAHDVEPQDVAAALRHVQTEHATARGVTICALACGAAEQWRPERRDATRAATSA